MLVSSGRLVVRMPPLAEASGSAGEGERAPILSRAEAEALQQEYEAWRLVAGLEPSPFILARFRRWREMAARQGGVLFAPWSVWGG